MHPDNQYPIGKYIAPDGYTQELRQSYIRSMYEFPVLLSEVVHELTDEQLDQPYRPGSWTIRQVIHHIADTQMHLLARVKFALSESNPTIKPYSENAWAEFIDSKTAPIEASLMIVEGMHLRWCYVLEQLSEPEWKKTFYHPETREEVSIEALISKLVWHSRHHYTQIINAKTFYQW